MLVMPAQLRAPDISQQMPQQISLSFLMQILPKDLLRALRPILQSAPIIPQLLFQQTPKCLLIWELLPELQV